MEAVGPKLSGEYKDTGWPKAFVSIPKEKYSFQNGLKLTVTAIILALASRSVIQNEEV